MTSSAAGQGVEWDASLPGAGAQRACAIAQLYVRMANYSPLTILVVDALCFAFASDGATVRELADYLGLADDRVAAALDAVPPDMRCTSRDRDALVDGEDDGDDVDDADVGNTTKTSSSSSSGGGGGGEGRASPLSSASAMRGRGEEAVRHYLNYKRLLPLVYVHVTRMLLALCIVPLPPCAYTEGVRRSRLGGALAAAAAASALRVRRDVRSDSGSGGRSTADAASLTTQDVTANISHVLRQREALDGVYCGACRSYTALSEFATTLTRCPVCGIDVLRSTVERIRDAYAARSARGESLVTLLPSSSLSTAAARRAAAAAAAAANKNSKSSTAADASTTAASPSSPLPPSVESAASTSYAASGTDNNNRDGGQHNSSRDAPELDSPLARDPFVVQQALAFLYLYSTPFAYVNEAVYVVHAEDILTAAEHERRLRGTASLAFRFRAAHRNAAAVHVRVVTQREVDAAKRRDNARKLAKRAHLPPWLRHYTTRAYLEATARRESSSHNTDMDAMWMSLSSDGSGRAASKDATTAQHSSAMASTNAASSPQQQEQLLTHAARFIVREVYEDDYDEVPLPRRRRARVDDASPAPS